MRINIAELKQFFALSFVMFMLFLSSSIQAVTLEANVDRRQAQIDDVIKLTVQINKKTSHQLQLSELKKHFKIIRGPTSTMHTSSLNGSQSIITRWTLDISPNRSGTLSIPPITVENKKTQPISITVLKPTVAQNRINADKPVFIHSEVDKAEVYSQEQIILIVRVFHRAEIEGKIIDPTFNTSIRVSLGEKKEYRTNIEDVRYTVKEWKYAIFPQQTGKLIIDSFILEGSVITNRSGFFLNKNAQRLYEKSLPIPVNVIEKPTTYPSNQWLPAEQVTLDESWSSSPPQFRIGEPITRTITLRVQKQLGANLPSQPTMSSKFFKIYPDLVQSEDNIDRDRGIQTVKTESIAIVPTKSGEFKLPKIQTYWWNTKTDKMEIAIIPERIINVEMSTEHAKNNISSTWTTKPYATQPGLAASVTPLWKGIAISMMVLWIATAGLALFLWKKLSGKLTPNKKVAKKQPDKLVALTGGVRNACNNNDPEDAKYSLIKWGNSYFKTKIISLGELSRLCKNKDLVKAIDDLQNILYKDPTLQWNGEALAKAIGNIAKKRRKRAQRPSALSELYPQ